MACYPDDATTAEALLERAAQALYQAKAAGRNAVQLYRPERRRFVRLDLDPQRFEIEVLAPADRGGARPRNLSRSGILFTCPEALEVGEKIEIRLTTGSAELPGRLRLRGRVVRLEELAVRAPEAESETPGIRDDRYEVGVALEIEGPEGAAGLLRFLEQLRPREADRQ